MDRVFVGASSGEVLMFEGGDHRGAIPAAADGSKPTCMLGHSKARPGNPLPFLAHLNFSNTAL